MYLNEEYDVLKFVRFHTGCYATEDRIVGMPLTLWVRDHPMISREQILGWTKEMCELLQDFYASREGKCFRYVNPWSFIVSDKEKLYLVDVGSPNNARLMKNMKKRMVREYFLPEEAPYYQRESIALDAYGFGKTFQFLLSNVESQPPLSRKEEAALQKFAEKCIRQYEKNPIQSFEELKKAFPTFSDGSKKGKRRWWKLVAAILFFLLIVILAKGQIRKIAMAHGAKDMDAQISADLAEETSAQDNDMEEEIYDNSASEDSETLNLELGILYMMDLNNYQKSQECFEKAGLKSFTQISECLQKEVIPEESLKTAIEEAKSVKELEVENSLKAGLYAGILRACSHLAVENTADTTIEYGKMYLSMDEKYKKEVLGNMALAYESKKEYDNAISMYAEQLEVEESDEMKEELYGKLSALYLAAGKQEDALETVNTGIEKYPDSIELYTKKVSICLEDKKKSRDAMLEILQESVDECSGLSKDESFKKLLEEHDFTIKKGKVCEN